MRDLTIVRPCTQIVTTIEKMKINKNEMVIKHLLQSLVEDFQMLLPILEKKELSAEFELFQRFQIELGKMENETINPFILSYIGNEVKKYTH